MLKKKLLFFVLLSIACGVQAKQLAGVDLKQSRVLGSQTLQLNSAGVRTKFIFDIYVASLYTSGPVKKLSDINLQQPVSMMMHFVYDEVEKEKLTDAWDEGFEDNLSAVELNKLRTKINKFNTMFDTVVKGDVVALDYLPLTGTRVSINNTEKGIVEGEEFYQSLLLIWLGDEPVTQELKEQLLGQ